MSWLGNLGGSLTGQTQARAISRGLRDQLASSGQAMGTLNQNYGEAKTNLGSLYDQGIAGLQPYAQQGQQAFTNLNDMVNSGQFTNQAFSFDPSNLANTPGYQFSMQQGLGALGNTAAARGGALGTNAIHDALNFSQGLAGTTYQNQFNNALQGYGANVNSNQQNYNNLAGLAAYGPQIAQQQAQLGQTYGTNLAGLNVGQGQSLADLFTGQGNAKAAAGIGKANAYGGAAQSLLSLGGQLGGGYLTGMAAK